MSDSDHNPPGSLIRVLYVEDDALVREITQELLMREDRVVVACESAEDALREFQNGPFHILITDIGLRKMSGLELAKAVSAMHPDVRVIIASGYSADLGLQRLGPAWRAVTKPFDEDQIDALITECMGDITHQTAAP